MSFLKSMDISASALTAQRMRMDVIAENIANINTTRTADGTPYSRRYTVFEERDSGASFSTMLNRQMSDTNSNGVRVQSIETDTSNYKYDYDPDHPDANEEGYVQLPNVDLVVEMVDLMEATRSYEANITAVNAFKSMALKALEI